MLRLYICGENSTERMDELSEGKTTVGRGPGNVLRIVDDSVSRTHSELFVWGADVIVRDLGSRNGTWVGDKALYHRQCGAKVGEVLRFGSVQARLEFSPEVGAHSALDATMEDNTAIHHYSRFMRSNSTAKGDRATQRPAGKPWALSVAPNALTRVDLQTMFVGRPGTDSEAWAAVMSEDAGASARQERDPRSMAARLSDGISASYLAFKRQFLAIR